MKDLLYFWSILFQILGLIAVSRSASDLSWDENQQLDDIIVPILFIVLGSAILDMIILLFYTMQRMSRLWTFWLNISQVCRVGMLLYCLIKAGSQNSPTNAYYAAVKTIIYSTASVTLRVIDYIKNGSSVNKTRLSATQRTILIVTFWNFSILILGALIFRFVEDWSFSEAWNFVNVTALTIGYGNIVPTTVAGKIITVTLGNILIVMAGFLVLSIKNLILPSRIRQKRHLFLLLLSIILYVLFGTVVFMLLENWTFINSLFFVWYTFTTVGYGNIVPQRAISWEFWLLYVYLTTSFYAFGLGLATNKISRIVENHQDGFTHHEMSERRESGTHSIVEQMNGEPSIEIES